MRNDNGRKRLCKGQTRWLTPIDPIIRMAMMVSNAPGALMAGTALSFAENVFKRDAVQFPGAVGLKASRRLLRPYFFNLKIRQVEAFQ
jgi:hypothetical protein